jgi:hypothetical protein
MKSNTFKLILKVGESSPFFVRIWKKPDEFVDPSQKINLHKFVQIDLTN